MEFADYQIRSMRNKRRPQVIVNHSTEDILTVLARILCIEDDEMMIIDGRGLTSAQWLCEQFEEAPNGYIVFVHLSEIPETEHADKIKSLIYSCIKSDWRAVPDTIFSEEWMNALAQKSIGIIAVSDNDEYKTSKDFKFMVGKGVCSYSGINDNGYEMII